MGVPFHSTAVSGGGGKTSVINYYNTVAEEKPSG